MKRWIAGIAAGLVFVIAVILIARHLVVKYYLLDGAIWKTPTSLQLPRIRITEKSKISNWWSFHGIKTP